MTDRKFKYQQPKNTDERIEAIYEELHLSISNNNKKPVDTLKDYVAAMLENSKEIGWRKKREIEAENYSVQSALFTLAFLAIAFLSSIWWDVSSDWEWVENNRFALRLWGTAFAAVYVGVSIERSSFFKKLWDFGFTKIVASIAVSALLIFSTGKASSLINSVFGVDAAIFPFTRAFISGMLAFQYSSPLLVVVGFFALLHAFDIIGYIKSKFSSDYIYDFPPWGSIIFLILAVVVLVASWLWIARDFAEEEFPSKIYRLAHLLDFNSNHACANIQKGVSVVFVGSDHSKVLVDTNTIQTNNVESFVNKNFSSSVAIPKKFFYIACSPDIRMQLN